MTQKKNASVTKKGRNITVEGLMKSDTRIDARVVAWEVQKNETGEDMTVPIGEASISFHATAKPQDMLAEVKKAAQSIEDRVDEARSLREQLNALLKAEA